MSHSTEPEAEEPSRSTGKRRAAHSGGKPAHQPVLSRWGAAAAALIAIVALALAIWALLRPQASSVPSPTAQQTAEAKGRACSAYSTVRTGISLQTHADVGADPIAKQAVAANARLAMSAGGRYLTDHVDPAVPHELADVMRSLAGDLQDLTIYALAGVPDDDPGQVGRLHEVEAKSARIVELCK
ncbi:hypothetical protein Mycsm_04741 [Mycobacterium sp. JS623]|uniref:hypothetical protein n=1 Tax=Mycobacterium sp. JS623 TaxID=212767 RepID=UPI0002A59E1E|nr:hypothetical protein [Mycobacterium sp. JS623]AGB24965.1 hypothetical protein Mycsm_04741 [Mycobacterium sp. JS623]